MLHDYNWTHKWDVEVHKLINVLGKEWFTSFASLYREFVAEKGHEQENTACPSPKSTCSELPAVYLGLSNISESIRVVPFPEQLLCQSGDPISHRIF